MKLRQYKKGEELRKGERFVIYESDLYGSRVFLAETIPHNRWLEDCMWGVTYRDRFVPLAVCDGDASRDSLESIFEKKMDYLRKKYLYEDYPD